MNQFLKSSFTAFIIGLPLIMASSCNDEDEKPSKRAILVDKSWQTIKYELNGQDVTADLDACDEDNFSIFAANGTFVEDIGDIKCDELETNYDGTWKFKANESIITIDPSDEGPTDWDILELTNTSFRISSYAEAFDMEIVVTMVPK